MLDPTPILVSDMPALTEWFYDDQEGCYVPPVARQRYQQPAADRWPPPLPADAPSYFEQHVGWLCDADKRSTAPTIRLLADIAKPRHFADGYESQQVTA